MQPMSILDLAVQVFLKSPFLVTVIVLVVIVSSIVPLFKGRIKGYAGEQFVRFWLSLFLSKKKYQIIHNVTIPSRDITTQIDHLILSEFGVFVIETKNKSGLIYGGEHDKNWTQKIGRRTHKIQNPIHQNYGHIKALSYQLKVAEKNFHSLVVFVGDAKLRKVPDNVGNLGQAIATIKLQKKSILSQKELEQILHRLLEIRLPPTWKTNREHVRNVKKKYADKD